MALALFIGHNVPGRIASKLNQYYANSKGGREKEEGLGCRSPGLSSPHMMPLFNFILLFSQSSIYYFVVFHFASLRILICH